MSVRREKGAKTRFFLIDCVLCSSSGIKQIRLFLTLVSLRGPVFHFTTKIIYSVQNRFSLNILFWEFFCVTIDRRVKTETVLRTNITHQPYFWFVFVSLYVRFYFETTIFFYFWFFCRNSISLCLIIQIFVRHYVCTNRNCFFFVTGN